MAKPVVFVIGASGNIGFAVVKTLSTKYTDKVEIRAGVRNPEKADKLKGLPGVTVVQAEMGKKQQLIETFRGVEALFINTSSSDDRTELTIFTAEAAKEAGVKFILAVSVPSTDTIYGRQFAGIEAAISKMGVPHAFIRLPFFLENHLTFKDSIVNESSIYSPADPTKPFTCVAATDAGKAGAIILVNYKSHTNKAYNIVSDRHSHSDIAAEFTKALGKEIKYIRIPYEAATKSFRDMGVSEWQTEAILEVYKLIDSGSPAADIPDRDQFEQLTGEKPTDLKTWISQNVDAFKA